MATNKVCSDGAHQLPTSYTLSHLVCFVSSRSYNLVRLCDLFLRPSCFSRSQMRANQAVATSHVVGNRDPAG